MQLTPELAASLAELPLRGLLREYPNKLDHVICGEQDLASPRALHPAFFGCLDWHSSVHGHWMLIRLLKRFDLPNATEIRAVLRQTLIAPNLLKEAEYLDQPNRESFERTYGWAWLLKLSQELRDWSDPDGEAWAANLKPLETRIVRRYLDFLPKQAYPIRHGLHANTAFGLIFAYDYASATANDTLKELIEERALTYFGRDTGFTPSAEPGGSDFLSPILTEADLMRRVLTPDAFKTWFAAFLPDFGGLLNPVTVSHRNDPQIGHLDGLNLSRAWYLKALGHTLDSRELRAAAQAHADAGLANVRTGHYNGEHWLASFAVYLLET